ncbi:MAG TPA: peptidoglycan-associated lipoprotein Pal [Gemmatimonadales bacterium]
MTRLPRAVPVLLLGAAVLATACRKTPETEVVPDEPDAVAVDSSAILDSIARARAYEDSLRMAREAELAAQSDRERLMAEAQAALTAPIYFEFDNAELSDDARATLEAKVPLLVANPGIRIRIGGHTDSRGSDEYNMALAQRRAASVRNYLEQRGVEGGRIEIVSYGEERPAVPGENEGAWAQNRRAEFEVLAGELTNPGGM